MHYMKPLSSPSLPPLPHISLSISPPQALFSSTLRYSLSLDHAFSIWCCDINGGYANISLIIFINVFLLVTIKWVCYGRQFNEITSGHCPHKWEIWNLMIIVSCGLSGKQTQVMWFVLIFFFQMYNNVLEFRLIEIIVTVKSLLKTLFLLPAFIKERKHYSRHINAVNKFFFQFYFSCWAHYLWINKLNFAHIVMWMRRDPRCVTSISSPWRCVRGGDLGWRQRWWTHGVDEWGDTLRKPLCGRPFITRDQFSRECCPGASDLWLTGGALTDPEMAQLGVLNDSA